MKFNDHEQADNESLQTFFKFLIKLIKFVEKIYDFGFW